MARLPRLALSHQLHHVIQRAHAGERVFRDDEDYRQFMHWLQQACVQFKISLHAYVLLPDHFHLLLTPKDASSLSQLMQWLGRYYVPYYNQKYQRSGGLWQGRYKACLLEPSQYFIPCCVLIESHSVRAHLAQEPEDYRWSSYGHHSGKQNDPIITDHQAYWTLGNTPFQREAAYRECMALGLSRQEINRISEATRKSWVLGGEEFKVELSKQTERQLEPRGRGRPRKA